MLTKLARGTCDQAELVNLGRPGQGCGFRVAGLIRAELSSGEGGGRKGRGGAGKLKKLTLAKT